MAHPRRDRAEDREQQDRAPEIVAVFVEEGSLGAVDIGRSTGMRRDRRVLVGVRLLDLRGRRIIPGKRGAHLKQRAREGADRRVR